MLGHARSHLRLRQAIALSCLLLTSPISAASSTGSPEPETDRRLTLTEALEILRDEGIETIYTSRLVDVHFEVDSLPPAGPTEQRLRTLLSPFALAPKAIADGRWMVFSEPTATVEGCLRSDPDGRPIAGATLSIEGQHPQARTDLTGCYRLLKVKAGEWVVHASRPGYVDHRVTLSIAARTLHRVDLSLRIDAETRDEIFVSKTPEEPALGTWELRSSRLDSSRRTDLDLLAAMGELPGVASESGVAFGVRGRNGERLTMVLDGMDIVEPYHFRHLGSLAGAVTPSAVEDVRLHRGSPPLVYGNRAGGVLEMVTTAAGDRFGGRLSLNSETAQMSTHGSSFNGRGRWLAAFRRGWPNLPQEIAEVDSKPRYSDGVIKTSAALSARQEISLQALWADDDFSFQPLDLLAADDPSPALFAEQSSHHAGLRHLISFGSRHLIQTLISDVSIDRRRFGNEPIFIDLKPNNLRAYVLDDHRLSRRSMVRVEGQANPSDRMALTWGAESSLGRTDYEYSGLERGPSQALELRLDERQLNLFGEVTWRPETDFTLKAGLRWDQSRLIDDSRLAPRVSLSFRQNRGIWRASGSRVVSVPATHELRLADGERTLPDPETTDYVSLGYELSLGSNRFSIEAYRQQIDDPRTRFVNLYKPVSRVPELEADRLRLTPDSARLEGLEARAHFGTARRRAGITYLLSRSEDWLGGRRHPRRADRRHSLTLWLNSSLPAQVNVDLRWRGATGTPTTPFLAGLLSDALTDFDPLPQILFEIPEGYNSARLPAEHQLDIRLSRQWHWRGLTVTAECGVDNLYDQRHVRGFDLSALSSAQQQPQGQPDSLPEELGLGRQFRWGLELAR